MRAVCNSVAHREARGVTAAPASDRIDEARDEIKSAPWLVVRENVPGSSDHDLSKVARMFDVPYHLPVLVTTEGVWLTRRRVEGCGAVEAEFAHEGFRERRANDDVEIARVYHDLVVRRDLR